MLRRSIAIAFVALLVAARALAQPSAPAPARPADLDPQTLLERVDQLMEGHVKANDFSGTVLLARDGRPLVSKGYGYANREWQIANTTDTKFRIGSITKQFTSMLIMQLREQGKLQLEDSLCVFVAPCPDAWKPVTIHHLLTHTSGIPTYTALPTWRETNMVPKSVEQLIALFRDLPLQWTPGERYAYNNSGYFLLGVVVEKASGRKYEQALREMILDPLGMHDTGYDWPSAIIPRRASGYAGRGSAIVNAPALDMQQPYAAGAMYSTVEDLLKWDQALYTDRLLPKAAKQIMWTPFREGYAYGWAVREPSPATFGHRQVVHGGGINGFSSMIIRLPETNVTAIVLSNNAAASASGAARDLLAIYFGQPYTAPAVRTVARIDPAIFDAYVGEYELRPGFTMTVTRNGNRFITQATGQGEVEIFPESETTFFPKVLEATITFVKDASGRTTHLVLLQGGREQQARKVK